MEHTSIVTPNELEEYAKRRDSEAILPELIFLLVTRSVDPVVCRIPYGDAINLPGFDGLVQTPSGFRQFVPSDQSYWEIGRSADPQDKATQDYRKRTAQMSPEQKAAATYVFVTPHSRAWPQPSQQKWLAARQADGWQAIRILDGVQVCDWLCEFPAIGKWLLAKMGLVKATLGVETAAEHWAILSQATAPAEPPLPPKLFLIGRELAVKELQRLLAGELQQLILATETEHDAADFVAAYLASLDEASRQAFANTCLFVSDPDVWQSFTSLRASHVLLATPRVDLEANEQLHLAARQHGHRIIIALTGAGAHGKEAVLPVLSPSQHLLEPVLREAGYSYDRARELSSAGAHNLAALKRHLRGLSGVAPYGAWESARLLSQASLLGRWHGVNDADRQAVEQLVGKSYGEWIETVRPETLRADTPLMQRNERWKILARAEAWGALGPHVHDDDLNRFVSVAVKVLGEDDPMFDLPGEERYAAAIHGKKRAHSELLREGLAETVALLGSRPEALFSCSRDAAERSAILVVRQLLENADWRAWASLEGQLPLLAEGAPDEFVDAVAGALEDLDESPFRQLFAEESGGGFGGRNYTTGLLWALETLAWSEVWLPQVTTLLGELASIDPGGTWANRPANSLVDIFLPWHPQTVASIEDRRNALKALIREQPDVGWKVLLQLLPEAHTTTTGTRKPVWRKAIPSSWKEGVSVADYWAQIEGYAELATEIAAGDPAKLAELVDRLATLPEPAHAKVLEHLASETVLALPEEERLSLWQGLTDLVRKHRKFSQAQWALPADRLKRIEQTAEHIAPTNERLRVRNLFSERDFDLYDENGNYEEQYRKLEETRVQAIEWMLRADGPAGVLAFAGEVDSPRKVGAALGARPSDQVDAFLLPAQLSVADSAVSVFIKSFVASRHWHQGWNWTDRQLALGWDTEKTLAFLLDLPAGPETWRRVTANTPQAIARYWACAHVNPWGLEAPDLLVAAERLSEHGQSALAVDCLYLLAEKEVAIPIALAETVLLGAVASSPKRLEQHHAVQVIKWLQQNEPPESETLARIEWAFMPLLNRIYGGEPKALELRLARDPGFFRDIIALVFRSDKDKAEERPVPTEAEKRVAQNAYKLLHGWAILPGTAADGSFDGKRFVEWLAEAKQHTAASGHLKIAMSQLGQALAHAPADPSGLWIHRSIAEALNARDAKIMRNAFTTGLFNRRGTFWGSAGEEERKIADGYRDKAKALTDEGFVRVADGVRKLADGYDRDAERQANESELDAE
jgi:hypothetical protein